MNNRNKILLDKIVFLCWIAMLLINVISEFIKNTLGGIGVPMLSYAFMMYFLVIYGKKYTINISVFPFFVFLLIYVFEYQIMWEAGRTYTSMGVNFNLNVWHMITLVPSLVSAVQVINKSDEEMREWIRRSMYCIITVVSVATIVTLFAHPEAIRLNASGKGEYFPFLSSYSSIYGMAIVMPYFLASLPNIKKKKMLFTVVIIAVIVSVFMAAFTIAIVAMGVGITCYLFLKIKNPIIKTIALIVTVLLGIFLVQTKALSALLVLIANSLPIEDVSHRLLEIAHYMVSGEKGNAMGRFDLYNDALQLIVQHPFFGNILWNPRISLSEHSTNLDIMSACGLIVFAMYFMFLWNVYKYQRKASATRQIGTAVLSAFIVLLFVSTLNPIWSSPEIMVFFILGPILAIKPKVTTDDSSVSVCEQVGEVCGCTQ